jgi:probable phosphoglycerate mutase
MPTRILLLRHAETTQPHVFNGFESDVPLSPRGLLQVRAVVPALQAVSPAAVVSSAMIRARQTAEPIAEACGVPLLIEPDLHERKVGQLAGKTNAETGGLWTTTVRRWQEGELDFAPPGAESFLDMQRRILPVFRRLAENFADQTLVVVAHGHVCRAALISLLPGLSIDWWERMGPIPNLALTELLHSAQGWEAIRMNEVPPEVKQVNGESP